MRGNRPAGLFLIIFGLFYLTLQVLGQFNIVLFQFYDLWPLFLVALGLLLDYRYFAHKTRPQLLIPGAILLIIGLLHMFETFTHWQFAGYTWPIYTLAPAIGLLHYWYVTKSKGALISGLILASITLMNLMIVVSLLTNGLINIGTAFSLIIIIVGVLLLTTGRKMSL